MRLLPPSEGNIFLSRNETIHSQKMTTSSGANMTSSSGVNEMLYPNLSLVTEPSSPQPITTTMTTTTVSNVHYNMANVSETSAMESNSFNGIQIGGVSPSSVVGGILGGLIGGVLLLLCCWCCRRMGKTRGNYNFRFNGNDHRAEPNLICLNEGILPAIGYNTGNGSQMAAILPPPQINVQRVEDIPPNIVEAQFALPIPPPPPLPPPLPSQPVKKSMTRLSETESLIELKNKLAMALSRR